jgi:hypothetical protein
MAPSSFVHPPTRLFDMPDPITSTRFIDTARIIFSTSTLANVVWAALYFVTLGFGPKYRERLRLFESLDPADALLWSVYERYSAPASFLGFPYTCSEFPAEVDPDESIRHMSMADTKSIAGLREPRPKIIAPPEASLEQVQIGQSLRAKQVVSETRLSYGVILMALFSI